MITPKIKTQKIITTKIITPNRIAPKIITPNKITPINRMPIYIAFVKVFHSKKLYLSLDPGRVLIPVSSKETQKSNTRKKYI